MSILDEVGKELLKGYQRTAIYFTGRSKRFEIQQRINEHRRTMLADGEQIKTTISATTKELDGLIKGEFGDKITEVLKEQAENIDKTLEGHYY